MDHTGSKSQKTMNIATLVEHFFVARRGEGRKGKHQEIIVTKLADVGKAPYKTSSSPSVLIEVIITISSYHFYFNFFNMIIKKLQSLLGHMVSIERQKIRDKSTTH